MSKYRTICGRLAVLATLGILAAGFVAAAGHASPATAAACAACVGNYQTSEVAVATTVVGT